MTILLLLISLLYALFTTILWVTWLRILTLPVTSASRAGEAGNTHPADDPFITVIIPVRNEAAGIGDLLNDLHEQRYSRFEVIVADDSSTDDTRSIVQEHALRSSYPLQLLALEDRQTASPKKRAISQSIRQARGELIVTTDGDCRVGPAWLAVIAEFYRQTGARLISGPVTFTRPTADRPSTSATLFDAMQTVEFASLIGTGACTMTLGWPTMCNGANLCYEKRAFLAVNGFAGVDHLASGDDELLMHKIAAHYPNGVRFLKNEAALVSTQPHRSWRGFYNQRKRWASKWRAYSSWLPSLLAVFVFLSNVAPVLAGLGWLLGVTDGRIALFLIVLKTLPEFLFLRQILVFLQKKSSVAAIPLTQLVYPFYVIFFGLAAQGKGYRWKGRDLQ